MPKKEENESVLKETPTVFPRSGLGNEIIHKHTSHITLSIGHRYSARIKPLTLNKMHHKHSVVFGGIIAINRGHLFGNLQEPTSMTLYSVVSTC